MITCPRCGFQAPDGSPWCPRCGYGCPYPVPYQQQPQQMPAMYQPQPQQQIPAQYDVVDVPPRPQPQEPPKPPKNKKKMPKWLRIILIVLGIILFLFIAIVVWAIVDVSKNPPVTPTNTPTPTFTETFTVTPTNTPIPSDTPVPTNTPMPTKTSVPTNTPIPVPDGFKLYTVKDGDNCYSIAYDHGISLEYFMQINNFSQCMISIDDQVLVPDLNTTLSMMDQAQPAAGVLGAVAQNSSDTCRIKGNINNKGERIYHCPGWRDYNKTDIDEWKGERWFCSAAEAEAAGWRAAGYSHGACYN